MGRPCHFIESAARSDGPSLTASIAARVPGTFLYTQYPAWEDQRWRYVGSVFDGFGVEAHNTTAVGSGSGRPLRVVVTLGTMPGRDFRRLVEYCVTALPSEAEVLWQTGSTDASGLGIVGHDSIPASELEVAM